MSFVGKLMLEKTGEVLGDLKFNKKFLGGDKIEFNGVKYAHIKDLMDFLDKKYDSIERKVNVVKRKSNVNKPMMKEIISEIKKHECIIF